MKKGSLSIIMIFFFLFSRSQEQLTLMQAVEIALKNNYSIAIAKNQEEIAKNNISLGNAGMLPEVILNAAANFSNNNTKQDYSNGTSLDKKGVNVSNNAAGVELKWTIFDGMKMFATSNKLKELGSMEEMNTKIQIENTIEQIIIAYFSIVQKKQLLIAADTTISIFEERVKISEEKWKIGNGSKSDFLQSQVDLNEQKSIRLKQRTEFTAMKIRLNQLLSRKAETDFDVVSQIDINTNLNHEEILNAAMSKNNSILFHQRNYMVTELSLKEIRAQRLPVVSFYSAYNFSRTQNQAGFFLLNQNLGFNAGLTASWTIFDGFNNSRQIRNNEISLLNSRLIIENTKTQIGSELQSAYNNYQTALESLLLEEENVKLAKENSEIMLERFRLGNSTSIDIKTAQKSYADALSRLIEARLEAKIAETRLMKLKGDLVK